MNASRGAGKDGMLEAEFATICQSLLAEPDEQISLHRIALLAVETVTGADECGIALRRPDESVDTQASTSELARRSEELQCRLHQGPCVSAVWSFGVCVIDDSATDTRWPDWASAISALGVHSVLSVRMETSADVVGALNLYAREKHAFDYTSVAIAQIYARHAASALSVADRDRHVEAALASRQTIGIAQGILMQRYGLNDDQAFEALRRYSQQHHSTVRELAERIAGTVPGSAA